jgi:CrcB protein
MASLQGVDASFRNRMQVPSPNRSPSREPRRSSHTGEYDGLEEAMHLSELSAQSPVQNLEERRAFRHESLEEAVEAGRRIGHHNETGLVWSLRSSAEIPSQDDSRSEFESRRRKSIHARAGHEKDRYEAPDEYGNLNEVGTPAPDQNPGEARINRYRSLEERKRKTMSASRQARESGVRPLTPSRKSESRVSGLLTRVYTISYLVFFSILGTLARLGLNALTNYTGAPFTASVIWANFTGTLILGFLAESSAIFNHAVPTAKTNPQCANADAENAGPWPSPSESVERRAELNQMMVRKPIPLYIGLATGFCGSLTSFSSFMRDTFLEMTNNLSAPGYHPADSPGITRRGVGKDFMAMLAVLIVTACISISALKFGSHIAILISRFNYRLSSRVRCLFDHVAVFLGVGCWTGAVIMAAVPPDRHWAPARERWRGQALFAIVFAPLGCILRFYLSLKLNGTFLSFPLGTFAANAIGTAVLGMAWDLQRLPVDEKLSLVPCQLLQGIMDGFCGCLTTVSTLALELSSLRRSHAYSYGGISVLTSLAILTLIMGAMKWTVGWSVPACV